MSDLFPPPQQSGLAQAIGKALALHQQGQLDAAEKAYKRVIQSFPDQYDALHLLGVLNHQRGRQDEALRLISAALRREPRSADAHTNLGLVLMALKREAEAMASFDKAVALEPNNVQALNNRARAHIAIGKMQDALAILDRVLTLQPQHLEARINRGNVLLQTGAHEEAIAEYDKVIARYPNHPGVHFNRGNALFARNRLAEAIAAYERSLSAAAQNAAAWNARGVALQAAKRNPEAIESFRRALALDSNYADAHFNMGLSLLTLGDYPRGFFEYEWRWSRTGMPGQRAFRQPLWNGEQEIAGKTILLHAEQGLGDTIQFARYAPILAKAGARVVLEVQPPLTSLLRTLDGAIDVLATGDGLPSFDVHCPLGRLPLVLKTEITSVPAPIPYLAAPDDKLAAWQSRLEGLAAPRIAIAWAGNALHLNDRNRSLSFDMLRPLLDLPAQFISVQREPRPEDLASLVNEPRLVDFGPQIEDFADTAAIVSRCDLVISVDTSVAHVAGALGRPLWVLLPYAPDWRWTLDAAQSPWYPHARLFRQPAPGDWTSVIAAVGEAIASLPHGA